MGKKVNGQLASFPSDTSQNSGECRWFQLSAGGLQLSAGEFNFYTLWSISHKEEKIAFVEGEATCPDFGCPGRTKK